MGVDSFIQPLKPHLLLYPLRCSYYVLFQARPKKWDSGLSFLLLSDVNKHCLWAGRGGRVGIFGYQTSGRKKKIATLIRTAKIDFSLS